MIQRVTGGLRRPPGLASWRALSTKNVVRPGLGVGPGLADFTGVKQSPQRSRPAGEVATSLKFYIETYGCQMNLSDSEIVRSILLDSGHTSCFDHSEADLILTNTCAVRENAESKVWRRLQFFQSIRKKNKRVGGKYAPVVGVLGCMAERLKEKLLEEDSVDFVCGPDAYRDIPNLLGGILNTGQKAANTMLSFEETYADIAPVREVNRASAFVSIMRG
jgi:tRNA-2-methylthio-N6-dimethylallyladenosine synthase